MLTISPSAGGIGIEDGQNLYGDLYYFLFNRITDAIESLDRGLTKQAREILCKAQRDAEERYINSPE